MKFSVTAFFLFLFSILIFTSCKDGDSDKIKDPKAENKKALGKSAEDILSDDVYKSMTIEFVYSEGFKPTEETKTALIQFLSERTAKPEGFVLKETVIDPPQGAPFNIDKIREIEKNNRTAYTTDDDLAVYVFFSNGKSNKDTEKSVTLGTAYLNTSIVVYKKTLLDLIESNQSSDLATLETTTLEHEFGHVLGLVNILNNDTHNEGHEDLENSRHCVIENCLMYFEANNMERKEVARFLQSRSTVPQLDSLCIEDLQAKGGK